MESQDLKDRARKSLQIAEHMLTRTYPVVNDPKLILAVAGDIYAALVSSMTALLECVKDEKQLGFSDDFESKFAVFRSIAPDYGFFEDEIDLVSGLAHIMSEHKDSPVEFARKDKFVICDEQFKCDVLSVDDMKSYLFKAGLFIEKTEKVLYNKELQGKHE